MNHFIKQLIQEKFESKKQQRFFYAKANEKGAPKKDKKKWSKWAKEFSKETDFENLPEKKEPEKEVEEIVDKKGNIARGKKDGNFSSKYITQDQTTDEVVMSSGGQMGNHAFGQMGGGPRGSVGASLKYWAESDMSKALGADKLLNKDNIDYDDATDEFEDLGIEDPEIQDKKAKELGFDPELDNGQVRLVENPKKFVEEYLESVLSSKSKNDELVKKSESEIKEINSILKRQLNSLKDAMNSNNLSIEDIVNYLKNNE